MGYLRSVGVVLGVGAALAIAVAGGASATVVTSPAGTTYTGTIKAASENGYINLHNPKANIECKSSVEAEVSGHGAGKPASGPVKALSFTECSNGWTVAVIAGGTLTTHAIEGTKNGTVTSSGATVTATNDSLGITCRYKAENTDVGRLTGSSSNGGSTATLDIEASIPFHSGSILCGSGASAWTGSYKVSSPDFANIDGDVPAPTATTITAPAGTTYTGMIKAASENGHVTLHNPAANISCNSSVEAEVTEHGAEKPASGPVKALSFTGCTGEWTTTVIAPGLLTIEAIEGTKNGTVVSSGATVTATNDAIGINCRYKTGETDIGRLTGSSTTGGTATLDIEASIPFHSGSIFCGSGASAWTGSYKVSSPDFVDVDDYVPAPTATTITAPAGTTYTGTVKAASENGHVTLHNPAANISCNSSVEAEVSEHGAGQPASGPVKALSFTGCTGEWTTTVNAPGLLTIEAIEGTKNGTVVSSGATVTATNDSLGITCRYKTSETDIGRLTGSTTTGATATLDLEAQIPFHSGSIFCGSGASAWTGSYKVSSPDFVDVDAT